MLAQLPNDSLGAYIISMSHTASDVLAVVLMQKECGSESVELLMMVLCFAVCFLVVMRVAALRPACPSPLQ
jgi:phosphoenolpyruvate carboxylase